MTASFSASLSLGFCPPGPCRYPTHSTFFSLFCFFKSLWLSTIEVSVFTTHVHPVVPGRACSITDGGPGIFGKWFPRPHPAVDIQLTGRARMSPEDRVGQFYGPGLGVAYISSSQVPFLSILKNRTKHTMPHNTKIKLFLPCFAYLYCPFPFFFLLPKFSSRSSLCISAFLLYLSCDLCFPLPRSPESNR